MRAALGRARRRALHRGDDRCGGAGRRAGAGMYASNGAALALRAGRSRAEQPEPDLFCMALLARFEGYFPGYSKLIGEHARLPDLGRAEGAHRQPRRHGDGCARPTRATRRSSTSAISRKAATRRRGPRGRGRRRPLRAPPDGAADRERTDRRGELPGAARRRATRSSPTTCATRLGPPRLLHLRDRRRERRTACSTATFASTARSGLRVVDASVFPRIPGFFIASAVYMVGREGGRSDPAGRPRRDARARACTVFLTAGNRKE